MKTIAPVQTHSGLKIILTNPFGYKNGELGDWYKDRFGSNFHNGVDFILSGRKHQSYGTPLVSVIDGVVPYVIKNKRFGHRGNGVFIQSHDRKTQTLHWHLSKILVKSGDIVKKGQVIGLMGNTGNVRPEPTFKNPYNGTHLHFMWQHNNNGEWVNVDPMEHIDLGNFIEGEDTGTDEDTPPLQWVLDKAETQLRVLLNKIKRYGR